MGGDGIDEGRRWGVGDTGDGGRLSISLGGVGGVVITGEEYGIFSCSNLTCASSSYRRAGDRFSSIAWEKPGENCFASITFCTRPAISCVKASFRAADCCSTRIAPLRESCGKGGSTTVILTGVEP